MGGIAVRRADGVDFPVTNLGVRRADGVDFPVLLGRVRRADDVDFEFYRRELVLFQAGSWSNLGSLEPAKAEGYSYIASNAAGTLWRFATDGRADWIATVPLSGYSTLNASIVYHAASGTGHGPFWIGAHPTRPMTWADPWVSAVTYQTSTTTTGTLSLPINKNTPLYICFEVLRADVKVDKVWLA